MWKYYREHGSNDGYILMGDLHSYFDSVDHDVVFREYTRDQVPKMFNLQEVVADVLDELAAEDAA